MPKYYRVRLPTRIASNAVIASSSTAEPSLEDFDDFGEPGMFGEPGVTFRVSDIKDGRLPTESTVDDGRKRDHSVGLSSEEANEMLASMAAAERAALPDRLPVVVALVVVVLALVVSTGVVQTLVRHWKEDMIEERINRPRARHGWTDRVGASKKLLGLPETPTEKIDYVKPPTRFFPSLR